MTSTSLTDTISGTNNLNLVKAKRSDISMTGRGVSGVGTLASGPFNMGVVLLGPRISTVMRTIVTTNIGIIAANTKDPTHCVGRFGRTNVAIVPMITSMTLTEEVRGSNTRTIMIRNVRSNNRVKGAAALTLIPRIISTISVPIVTTNNVNSKHKVTTTFVLNTSTIRMNAHFMMTARSGTRRGFGGTVLGTGSVSAIVANRVAKRPIHILHGGLAERCLRIRGRRADGRGPSLTGLRRVNGNTLEETAISNSGSCNSVVTKRVTNLVSGRRAYRRVVRRCVARYGRIVLTRTGL